MPKDTEAPAGTGTIDFGQQSAMGPSEEQLKDPKIDTPGASWWEMEQWRALPRQLRGGLAALQALLVPFSNKEDKDSYNRRQVLLDFVDFYWMACGHLGGLPFMKPAMIGDTIPEKVRAWMKDIDGQKTDLPLALRSLTIQSVGFGKLGSLLLPREDNPALPTLHIIDTQDDLDDQAEGTQPMRFRRWVSTFPSPARPWWKRREEQIWTVIPGDPEAKDDKRWVTWTVHERKDPGNLESPWNDDPTAAKAGTITGMIEIPYVPWTAASLSEDEAPPWVVFPPLWWLARANFVWMNQNSDKDHNLRWSQVEQAFAFLTDPKELDNRKLGGGNIWALQSGEGTSMDYLSPTGIGFANARINLEKLEVRMDAMAHKTSANRFLGGSAPTATGVRVDLKEATSMPQAWAHGWSDSSTTLVRLVGQWMGETPEALEEYAYVLPADFDAELAWAEIRETLHKVADRGELLPDDLLPMLAQVGGLPPGVDSKELKKMVDRAKKQAEERAKLAASLPVPTGRAEDEEDEDEDEEATP